jgi:hypothetical protein
MRKYVSLVIPFSTAFLLLSTSSASAAEAGRVYLGVFLAPGGTGHAEKEGALVTDVIPGSPAEKAGIRPKDVIVSMNGKALRGSDDLRKEVEASQVGDVANLEVRRGDESLKLEATLGSLEAAGSHDGTGRHEATGRHEPAAGEPRSAQAFLGIGFGPVPESLAYHLGLAEGVGAVVGDVRKDTPAEKAGIKVHDVIVTIDGKEIRGPEALREIMNAKKPGNEIRIDWIARGEKKTAQVVLAERPANLSDGGMWPAAPEPRRRGRITLQLPGGSQREFQFPNGIPDPEEFLKEFRSRFPDFSPDDLSGRLRGLVEKFHGSDGNSIVSESTNSVVRVMDGEYDVTVKSENGRRTVTVKKGDKTLAEELPWDKLSTLPEEARQRVEKAAESLKEVKVHGMEAPHIEPAPEPLKA